MPVVRITKEFRFEMAHALWNYDGPCRNVHGHSYILYVTFYGEPVNDPSDPHNGMIIDFGDLKKIVEENVVDRFDHSLMVADFGPKNKILDYQRLFDNIIISDYQPTCENLVTDIARIISSKTPAGLSLHSIKLYETATSFAEWYASDNQ